MGCVFQNPYPSLSAGALIDACGCKGWKQGGAVVSSMHANFILNENNATSADIKTLIGRVKNHVYQTTGILLREEIRCL
jgi:UDP-N-acetylmuramate dehydrogenase